MLLLIGSPRLSRCSFGKAINPTQPPDDWHSLVTAHNPCAAQQVVKRRDCCTIYVLIFINGRNKFECGIQSSKLPHRRAPQGGSICVMQHQRQMTAICEQYPSRPLLACEARPQPALYARAREDKCVPREYKPKLACPLYMREWPT